ncbi:MFS transporter [Frankia sp. QA3]|uniref:MFS transporter n=1 Tax=Frankia sp. QA3 TaxID=710111 RepID=UPI000269C549|nr:MFS transporter [Frankia sp. QA3]EIV93483.1 arabinose efflux permease family protein [Frankia sp. QA3]
MSTPSTVSAGPPAIGHRHLGLSLALLALAQLIFSLDLNIVFVALPDIKASLHFAGQTEQWVVSAYAVFAGGFLLLGGRAADLLGRRRMFVLALSIYAVSSFVGGLAGTPAILVVARAIQGVGAALLLPSTLSLINTLFEEGPRRNRALAVWGGAGASGLTVGALLGGVLTQAFGWSAVFFVNVPLAAVVALAALAVIPADPPRLAARRFDLPGALTVTAGVTMLVFVLVQGPESGWTSGGVIAGIVAAVILLPAFVAMEARTADPLLALRLLRNRPLTVAITVTFIYMGTFGTLPYFLTRLLQEVHGYSALRTGLAFAIPSVAIATGTQLGERMTTAIGTRLTLLSGFALGAVGTAVLAIGFDSERSFATLLPGLILSGVAQGTVWTAMWIAAASGVAAQEQGVASGMASTTLNIGNAVGLAVLVAIATADITDQQGDRLRADLADGTFTAVLLTAAGLVIGLLLVALALPRTRAAAAVPALDLDDPVPAPEAR